MKQQVTQSKQEKPSAHTRRMRAKNKSGTVTYIVQTSNEQKVQAKQQATNSDSINQELKNIQIEQEKVVALLENMSEAAKKVDYKILDELNSIDSEEAAVLKEYLNSVEMLAHHWHMVKKEKYMYRVQNHGHLDTYINEIPRATNEGKIINIKTFVLSCKTPYMKTKDGAKVFISKEYSNAAGKLHLNFYTLHDLVVRELSAKLDTINKNNSRGSILAFFKTLFSSGQDGVFHPLFKETVLLRKIKKQVKIFELCIRNFEETYIAMIKDLQEKTFKMNVDNNNETSIIMKRREKQQNQEIVKTKLVDNQMFDLDGNILTSLKNSFNQSILCGSVNSRIGSEFTQSIGNNQMGIGPQAHISPVANLRKGMQEDSIKPTSSSQGPSQRLQQTISPTNMNNMNSGNPLQTQNRCNLSRSSRNSGFKPLQSLQNIDCNNVFNRKQEFIGSVISTNSQPMLVGQTLQNLQKKTISPQIIKHNYMPLQNISLMNQNTAQNNSNDELVVKYVDMNDDKENIYAQSNLCAKASVNNFAFQTPNPNQTMMQSAKGKFMITQTTGLSSTPGQNVGSLAGTIIQQRSSNMQDYPQSTNIAKTKMPQELQRSEPFEVKNQADNKAYYKNNIINNKKVIKTSRNLFNNDLANSQGELVKDSTYQLAQPRISINQEKSYYQGQKLSPGNEISYATKGQTYLQMNAQKSNQIDQTENSFENSSNSSCNDDGEDSDISNDDRNQINQSSMLRASRIDQRLEQINPNDLMNYNNLIEQFNS